LKKARPFSSLVILMRVKGTKGLKENPSPRIKGKLYETVRCIFRKNLRLGIKGQFQEPQHILFLTLLSLLVKIHPIYVGFLQFFAAYWSTLNYKFVKFLPGKYQIQNYTFHNITVHWKFITLNVLWITWSQKGISQTLLQNPKYSICFSIWTNKFKGPAL
jgi:hypothetical protein